MADDTYYVNWVDELIADGKNMPRDGQDFVWPAYNAWVTKCENMFLEVVGSEHVYYLNFHAWANATVAGQARGALAAALQHLMAFRDDLAKGRLTSFRSLVTGEVFSDFLDMAQHLLENGYKDPAASLVGAVLERGLRDIAAAHDVTVKSRDDLTSLANRLAEKGVYNRLTQKNLNVWIAIRNHADHGQFDEYKADDVQSMHSDVSTFLSQYSPQ